VDSTKMKQAVALLCIFSAVVLSQAQSYDDKRCKCICPSISSVTNSTETSHMARIMYISNVPPKKWYPTNLAFPCCNLLILQQL
jgi:hypothetical protein